MNLRETIAHEYQTDFARLHPAQSIDDVFALFCKTIAFDLNRPAYKGLSTTILPYLEKAFQTDEMSSIAILKVLAPELEVFGKKIIELVDGDLSHVPTDHGKIYLKEIAKYLRIDHLDCVKQVTRYIRNDSVHKSLKLTYIEYFQDLRDVILTYLLIAAKRYNPLYFKMFPEQDFTEYLESVVEDYNFQQAIFVDLEVREYIEIIGKEVQAKNVIEPARQDTILNLRRTMTDNQWMLLGQAGMGKTTSLLRLAMNDANARKTNPLIPLPVYITLASFDDFASTIPKQIAKRLGRTLDFTLEWLQKGKITLYLDGFNEVLERLRNQLVRSIQRFIDDYPQVKIILASRPVAYEDIDFKTPKRNKNIPAFLLLEMKETLIEDFIRKNYKGNQIALWAFLKQPENLMLLQTLNNPLYLAEFLTIYQVDIESPPSTTAITERFIYRKYQREKAQIDITFNAAEFSQLMAYYTLMISDDDQFGMSNPQVPYRVLHKIVESGCAEYKTEMTTAHFLRNATSMHLLVKHREGSYAFAHQSYQDFFIEYEAD